MNQQPRFRCPFEEKGKEEGTILEIILNDDPEERLAATLAAFESFHTERSSSPAIRLTLPQGLLDSCSSILELRSKIVPYQAEVVAAELCYRLYPFLPHQMRMVAEEQAWSIAEENPQALVAAGALMATIGQLGFPLPMSPAQIAIWLEVMLRKYQPSDPALEPQMHFQDQDGSGTPIPVLTLSPSGMVLHADRRKDIVTDPAKNRNTFGIVKAPFYPEAFGRFSERVEIVISREADFAALPMGTRRRIRLQSNKVLAAHGIALNDLASDRQDLGVWVHE